MSKKKSTLRARQQHTTSPAFRRAYINTVALEFLRNGGSILGTATSLNIARSTLHSYMKMPEWEAAVTEAQERISKETTKRIVLERSMLDEILIKTLLKIDPTKKAYIAKLFEGLIDKGYTSIGLGSEAPKIGITATAQAGTITANGKDAFQVYEAEWLTERQEQWGDALTQKVRAYLASSIKQESPVIDGDPSPKTE